MFNTINRSSPMRMMGLSSGMDTDFMIQQMMKVHQMRIDNKMRGRTLLQWKQETHNGIKEQINDLRNSFFRSTGATAMFNRSMYNSATTQVTGKNASAVTVKTSTSSTLGSMTIGRVVSLAKGASVTSAKGVTGVGQSGLAMTTRLENISNANLPVGSNKMTFSKDKIVYDVKDSNGEVSKDGEGKNVQLEIYRDANGVDYFNADGTAIMFGANGEALVNGHTIFKMTDGTIMGGGAVAIFTGDTPANFTDSVNGYTITKGADGKYSYTTTADGGEAVPKEIEFTNGRATITVGDKSIEVYKPKEDGGIVVGGGALGGTLTYGKAEIEINGKEVTLNRNMTIDQMLKTINNTKDIGVTMSYDRLADKFLIESKTVGGSSLSLIDLNGSNFFQTLGIDTNASAIEPGTKAVVYINGEKVESNTNTFDYRGVSITLNHATETGGVIPPDTDDYVSHADDITVTVKRDATDAVKNIVNTIDAFNAILKRIDDLLRERKGVNEVGYKPLTDEEKSVMSDKQVEEWEAIAKKGILKGDPGLQSLANRLRSEIYASVRSVESETGHHFMNLSNGQIVIDEDRLKTALEENPDRVADFFAGIEDGKGSGLFYRINDAMTTYVNVSQIRTLRGLEDSIRQVNEQMDKMMLKMYAEEDKLYKQFAAMETALSKLQSQGDWMTSMLGGGN